MQNKSDIIRELTAGIVYLDTCKQEELREVSADLHYYIDLLISIRIGDFIKEK